MTLRLAEREIEIESRLAGPIGRQVAGERAGQSMVVQILQRRTEMLPGLLPQ